MGITLQSKQNKNFDATKLCAVIYLHNKILPHSVSYAANKLPKRANS